MALAFLLVFLAACSSASRSQENASQKPGLTSETASESVSTVNTSQEEATDAQLATSNRQSARDSQPTGQSTPTTDRPYIDRLLPEAQRIQQEYGIPVDTTIAIAIHETGWGKYTIGRNNHFGLRCASDDCVTLSKGGANIRYETCPDAAECFNIFAQSITELSNGQPGDLRVIYKNGYATSSSWVRKVRNIRRQVRKTLKKAGISPEA